MKGIKSKAAPRARKVKSYRLQQQTIADIWRLSRHKKMSPAEMIEYMTRCFVSDYIEVTSSK